MCSFKIVIFPYLIKTWVTKCVQKQHLFNGFLSGTTRVSRYQKDKTNLDLLEQEIGNGSGISWAMQICTTSQHASTPPLSLFTGRMPFLPPTEDIASRPFG